MRPIILALATVLVTSAAPALADEWIYHGGPKSPDSLSWRAPDRYTYGPGPYGYGPYAAYDPYGYAVGPYAVGPAYGWYDTRHWYGCGPATLDCYNRSRLLQGTR
jgi:hypothetical protein